MISKEEVKRIAKLARLELSEKESEKMQKELSSILDYFNMLKNITAQKVKKASLSGKPKELKENAARKDVAIQQSSSLAGDLVNAAPDKKDGYIKVKNVF